jgi:hypothetical protein
MERTSAALGVASDRPKNTPRALVCQRGERSPIMYGRKMTPPLPGGDLGGLPRQQIECVALALGGGLDLRLPKLIPEPAQAAARGDHRAQQQVDSRQGVRHGDQRRLRQAAVVRNDDDCGGSRHLGGDARLDHANLQRRRGAVHRPGHHRSAGPQPGGLGGLPGDFSLNAVVRP